MDILQQLRPQQPFTSGSTPATSHHTQNIFAAAVSTLAEQPPHPPGNLEHQENPPPRRANNKRRLSLRSRQDSFRRPRPLHLDRAAKSSSAVPTITDLAVGRNKTTSSKRSWLAKSSISSIMSSQSSATSPAADLLRQTMLHNTRPQDEDSDHGAGSGVSTPLPGISTPNPDFTDKRFPGIHNSTYFAQNTPPQTPRTLSHPESQKTQQNVQQNVEQDVQRPESQAKQQTEPQQQAQKEVQHEPTQDTAAAGIVPVANVDKSSRSSSGTSEAPVSATKGTLSVNILQGRGLRPSTAPYVVCTYQLNEDISDGPTADAMDTRQEQTQGHDEDLAKGVAMRRMGSDQGKPMAIPGGPSRQSSQTDIAKLRGDHQVTEPVWSHEAVFDIVGEQHELDISVYDKKNNEAFLGHIRFSPVLENYETPHEAWFKLKSTEGGKEQITGDIKLRLSFQKPDKRTFGPEDFEILKLIGKGTFGQVFQVRKRDTLRIYAMKVLSKKVIIQKKEVQHTIGERNILVRTATAESLFIVGLKFSFQTPADLYLVTDYMSGGELFWHLQREGRFHEERAKFYIAELILALRHLHQHDIVYRDLKPENILLDANGHIALCDFGLSKANLSQGDTTNTFCGTTEYLAPEVLLDEQGYTKMVDFWSLGVLVFEMCCGWSPFYAEDTQQMYKNIAFGKVRFPRDALSTEGRNFVKGLLNRNPNHRLGAKADADELMAHPFFADVDWEALGRKDIKPPFKPILKGELDTSNFDPEFTNALASGAASSLNARAAALASGVNPASTPLSPTLQTAFKGFTFVDESTLDRQFGNDVEHLQGQYDGDELNRQQSSGKSRQMSGVVSSSEQQGGIFNDGMLEDI